MDRRNVVYLLAGSALSALAQTEPDGMIYRPLGRTGERVFGNRTRRLSPWASQRSE